VFTGDLGKKEVNLEAQCHTELVEV